MEIKTTYIAFDSKEFDDEELCTEYEFQKKYCDSLNAVHFYDYRGRERHLKNVVTGEADSIFFVYLPTKEAVESAKEIWTEQGLMETDSMVEPGFYFYEDCDRYGKEYWHKVEDFPESIADTYDSYRMAKSIKERLDNEN